MGNEKKVAWAPLATTCGWNGTHCSYVQAKGGPLHMLQKGFKIMEGYRLNTIGV